MAPDLLGSFEYFVLVALTKLSKDEAYGMHVRRLLCEALGRDVALGAVYSTLERLHKKGYIRSATEPAPRGERHGNARRFYEIQASGARAVRAYEAAVRQVQEFVPTGSA
jgi:PadR family transcriptional regulator, regulatory protein PadR